MLDYTLTEADYAFWEKNHYLHLKDIFTEEQVKSLKGWSEDLFSWPETPGKWMKYYENSTRNDDKILCRVENFMPYHEGIRDLSCGHSVMGILDRLMGEKAVLFKEKINLKLAGGAGFGAHQDAPAFISFNQKYHITMMVAVDDATVDNGCMQFSDAVDVYNTLPQSAGGTIAEDVEANLPWASIEAKAGDIMFFDSYIPHRSPTNSSDASRRAMFITYNRESEGNRRDDYFADKREKFPPDCEKIAGKDYSASASLYNLGNPIK